MKRKETEDQFLRRIDRTKHLTGKRAPKRTEMLRAIDIQFRRRNAARDTPA